jgi:hypothetical protein
VAVSNVWDHIVDFVWAPILAVIAWAFHLDQRVGRLETQREAMVDKINGIESEVKHSNEKLDKLIDKLL